jgi:hypothetical protein
VLANIREALARLQLDQFFRVLPGLYTGHSYPDEIFVALDGKRVPKQDWENAEEWLLSVFKSY